MNYNYQTNCKALTKRQLSILNNFLLGVASQHFTKLIYRGESLKNLREKLNINLDDDLYNRLNKLIFTVGEKSRVYQKLYFKNLKSKSIFSINETTERVYKYIFDKINRVVTESNNSEISEFKDKNPEFTNYFQSKKNKDDFISKIKELSPKEQLQVRDYYLIFLHRVGRFAFHRNTFLLSTSSSKQTAEFFSKEDGILFVSWRNFRLTSPLNDRSIGVKGLPVYNSTVFSFQREVTIEGGLFPQNILGFIDIGSNIFHINPNIFEYPDLIEYMIKNGIPTDQTDFEELLRQTNYSGYFTDGGGEMTDSL